VGRDDRLETRMTGKRRQKRIDQAAGDHEQVADALAQQGIENEIHTGCHVSNPRNTPRLNSTGRAPLNTNIKPVLRRSDISF
jgi:hypothetical protein